MCIVFRFTIFLDAGKFSLYGSPGSPLKDCWCSLHWSWPAILFLCVQVRDNLFCDYLFTYHFKILPSSCLASLSALMDHLTGQPFPCNGHFLPLVQLANSLTSEMAHNNEQISWKHFNVIYQCKTFTNLKCMFYKAYKDIETKRFTQFQTKLKEIIFYKIYQNILPHIFCHSQSNLNAVFNSIVLTVDSSWMVSTWGWWPQLSLYYSCLCHHMLGPTILDPQIDRL